MANIKLLRDTLEYVRSHPEKWNQLNWAYKDDCGTKYCFAGTAVHLAGYKFQWERGNNIDKDRLVGSRISGGELIREKAQTLFDISFDQSEDLFNAENSIFDIERLINQIELAE
jgi:hypothetical protein